RPDAGAEESTSSAALVRSRAAGSRVRPCRRAADAGVRPRTAPLAQRRSTGCGQHAALRTRPRTRGGYVCRARGSESREIYTQTELAVLSPRGSSTRRRRRSAAKRRSDGLRWRSGHALRCDATGERGLVTSWPSIDWVKDGQPLSQKPPFVRQLGQELRLRGLVAGDSGLYQCLAGSPAGSAQRLTQLIVLAASAASESAIGGQPPRRGGLFSQPDRSDQSAVLPAGHRLLPAGVAGPAAAGGDRTWNSFFIELLPEDSS
uniref:Ig-like domain-containing protein n=1 Tax=Macrostomum lignano TaxID=282301 RepID=A0A1I8FH84_9PLAT